MIARNYGTKFGLLFSIIGSSVTFFFQALAWDYNSLLVARVAAGLTGNSIPVALTYIGMKVPQELKPKYMSYVGLCITSSFVIGPLIGGSLSKYGLSAPFYFAGFVAGCGFLLCCYFLDNAKPPPAKAGDDTSLKKENYIMLLMGFFKTFPFTVFISMSGPYYMTRFGFDSQDLGYLFSGHGCVISLNTIFIYPIVTRNFGNYGTYLVGTCLLVVGFFVSAWMVNWYTFAACTSILAGFGFGYMINSINPLADRWASPQNRPMVMAYQSIMENLGFTAGPIMFGYIYRSYAEQCDQACLAAHVNATSGTCDAVHLRPAPSCDDPANVWIVGSCVAGFAMCLMATFYFCIFAGAEEQKQIDDQLKKKEAETPFKWEPTEPTEEDYLLLGKDLSKLLVEKKYDWVKYRPFLLQTIDDAFPELSTVTKQERARDAWWLNKKARQLQQEFKEFGDTHHKDALEAHQKALAHGHY